MNSFWTARVIQCQHNRFAVRRPARVETGFGTGDHVSNGATSAGNHIGAPVGIHGASHENDVFTVRRPSRQAGLHGRLGKLQALTPVDFAAPKNSFRNGYVGEPLTVTRKCKISRRNPAQIGSEPGSAVVTNQLAARSRADRENPFAVLTGDRGPKM